MGDGGTTRDVFLDWDNPAWENLNWDNNWNPPAPATTVAAAPGRPWYYNTRVLGGAIGIASATLVVATVLLLTVKSPGDFPTAPLITKATSAAPATRMSTPPPAPVTSAVVAAPESPADSPSPTEPPPGPIGFESSPVPSAPTPASVEPAEATDPPRGATATVVGIPRPTMSRSPMSFTPSPVPRR